MTQPCVYIMTNKRNGTLYTGVTSNLVQRVWQHKNNLVEGFTKRYGTHTLVLVRNTRYDVRSYHAGKENQGMEKNLEVGNDFRFQP